MDNQHRKITGYRDLTEADVALMNVVKMAGGGLETILKQVTDHVADQRFACARIGDDDARGAEQQRLDAAQPERWAAIARTHFQEGLMALTRAVAQPSSF